MLKRTRLILLASLMTIENPAKAADAPNVHVERIPILSLSFMGRTSNDASPAYPSAEIVVGSVDGPCGGAYRYGAPRTLDEVPEFERINVLLLDGYLRKQKITIRFRCDLGATPLILEANR